MSQFLPTILHFADLPKVDDDSYNICVAGDADTCIELVQYDGSIGSYINKYLSAPEDVQDVPVDPAPGSASLFETPRKNGNWVTVYESTVYYLSHEGSTLIMVVRTQEGDGGFHGGENYDARDILKVIDL